MLVAVADTVTVTTVKLEDGPIDDEDTEAVTGLIGKLLVGVSVELVEDEISPVLYGGGKGVYGGYGYGTGAVPDDVEKLPVPDDVGTVVDEADDVELDAVTGDTGEELLPDTELDVVTPVLIGGE